MEVKSNVLDRQYIKYKEEYLKAIQQVLESGWYVLGEHVLGFENEFKQFINANFCIGLNSGLDALNLAVRALGIGENDEVIVPANTYIASVLAITENKATPIFVEPDRFYNIDPDKIEEAITTKTKALLCVHLYGQACRMDRIKDICKKRNLFLIEDCAQSHGAQFNGKMTGTFGDIGCFSFYPTKNLGGFGDGGAVVTNNKEIADYVKCMRNYGSKVKYHNDLEGVNSRLDEIQAAMLSVKLRHLKELTNERKDLARIYQDEICNERIIKPSVAENADHVYHQFVIRCKTRDRLQAFLLERGIHTQIHYPIPPHLAKCYHYLKYQKGDFPLTEKMSNEILSLPLYNGMCLKEQKYVINVLNDYRD